MGKSMNLNNLSPEEAQQILKVIQKDFELRQKERERLSKIEEVVNEEETKTEVLTKQTKFNENCCIRCCQTFGIIFNRKQTCQACKLYVCKSCAKYDDHVKGYFCKACLNEAELKQKSLDWFYNNVSKKYKRFGSAKVVRTLYKYADGSRHPKFHSDNESDSGYDPSLYSSFGQSGSLRVKSRPSLKSAFPEILINDDEGNEIDNSLFSPPPPFAQISPQQTNGTIYHANNNVDNDTSPDTSFESIQISTQTSPTPRPRTVATPTQTIEDVGSKELEKRDIYREAFESTKRTEEAKFKVRFDNLLQEMQTSFETLSPRDGQVPSAYGSTSYGDLMTTYRTRVKDLLVSLSQRLELAVESFDETCANNPSLTSQKVKQMISKLVEDRLGESLDLTSDEAVSDLSSLSDESGELKSLEDQIAQAVIARVLELHRNQNGVHLNLDEPQEDGRTSDSSGSEVKTVVRSRNSSVDEEPNLNEMVPNEHISTKRANRLQSSESDINANITKDRVKWEKHEKHHIEREDEDLIDGEKNDSMVFSRRLKENQQNEDSFEGEEDISFEGDKESSKHRDKRKRSDTDSERHRSDSGNSGEVMHRDRSDSELSESNKQRTRLGSNVSETDDIDDAIILKNEFEKLRTFAKEVVPRPLYEEAKFVEEVEPEPIEESMECVTVDHEESQEEFSSRLYTYDKVHDTENHGLPDFTDLDYEYHDFGVNEVDPDLLSMNLAPILEETEEELAEEGTEEEEPEGGQYEQDWRGNWLFKGASGMAAYNSISGRSREFGDGYVMVPKPNEILAPQIGNRDVDDMSDLSENEDLHLSDEENSFYSKTSEEIARITRKSSSSTQAAPQTNISIQTEDESDLSDFGPRSSKLDQSSFDSRVSEQPLVKLTEELIPAEGDDPKFEIPPDSVTISEGEPAKLSCRVAGTQPLDVFWYKVGEELVELENSENYEISQDGSRYGITMYNMTRADAGQYMCMAINEKGKCCQYLILNVKKNTNELKAPEFLKTLSDVEVTEGHSVKFRCKVKGIPQPRVVWYKDGQLLMNQLNYKLEKFGNRDYILAIDVATMDEDAEYCALAKNIAGEARSSAQLIVEPKHKPESVPASAKSAKPEKSEESAKPKSEFPDLSYLGLGRSKSSSKPAKSSSSSLTSSSKVSASRRDSEIDSMSEKVAEMKDSVSDVAADMLSSSKEKEAAENLRKVTGSTLDYLNNTDAYIMREKGVGDVATSTPRNSGTERLFNPDSDASHIPCDTSDVAMETTHDTSDVTMETTHDRSDESQKSEILFNLNPMTINMGSSAKDSKPKAKTGSRTLSRSSSEEDTSIKRDNKESHFSEPSHVDKYSSSETSHTISIPNISQEATDLSFSHDSPDSEVIRVNLGPKRENKQPYRRDFYITDTPQMKRKTPENSPREEKQTVHTEEKIYLAAGTVSHLENKVQTLQDKMRAMQALQEQDKLAQLENQVADTAAKVVTSEHQVKRIELAVSKLAEQPKVKAAPSPKTRQAPSIPPPRPITPPREEKPEPTFLKGVTKEQDLPESRTEFNEEYGSIELPSVNRLKAMFGGNKADDRDSSVKRVDESGQEPVHSITARSVPKEQLEKLRKTTDDHPHSRVAMTTASNETPNPGRATALLTGQQVKVTPNMPKQVYQSHDFSSSNENSDNTKMLPPKQSIQISSSVKQTSESKINNTKAQSTVKLSLGVGNTNKPVASHTEEQGNSVHPIKTTVTSESKASKSPSQSEASKQNLKSGQEIDNPDERKSPKIKSGAISAMSKFWEKRSQGDKDSNAPELLEYD